MVTQELTAGMEGMRGDGFSRFARTSVRDVYSIFTRLQSSCSMTSSARLNVRVPADYRYAN
jgi:hypothetical protein